MKTINLSINYEEEKYSTIKLYISQRGMSIEEEVSKTIDALYNKHVPANVREFFELKKGQKESAVSKVKKNKNIQTISTNTIDDVRNGK